MAAVNLFATHFALSHLARAKLSILLNSMELNTGVSPLAVSNQTSLNSEAFTVSLKISWRTQELLFLSGRADEFNWYLKEMSRVGGCCRQLSLCNG